jgi:hypothetical protein
MLNYSNFMPNSNHDPRQVVQVHEESPIEKTIKPFDSDDISLYLFCSCQNLQNQN